MTVLSEKIHMNFHKNSLSRSRNLFDIIQHQLRIKSQHIRNRMEFFELDKEHQCTKKKKKTTLQQISYLMMKLKKQIL